MTWLLTGTGAQVDLRFIAHDTISASDIARALSRINRFNGHTSRPYTVAEHSLHVVTIMERELGVTDPGALFAGLLHDAHEAYVGDMATPLKAIIGLAWVAVEAHAQRQVLTRFDALAHYERHSGAIKLADITALAVERRDLLPPGGSAWPILDGVDPLPFYRLADFDGMDQDDWRDAFIERFAELYTASQLAAAA